MPPYPGSSSQPYEMATWQQPRKSQDNEQAYNEHVPIVTAQQGCPKSRKILLVLQTILTIALIAILSALQSHITPELDIFIFKTQQVHPSFVFPLLVSIGSFLCSITLLIAYIRMKSQVSRNAVIADVVLHCIFIVGWVAAAYAAGVALVGFRYSNWPPNCSAIIGVESWFCPLDIFTTVLCLVMALLSVGGLLCKMRGHYFVWIIFVPGVF